MAIFHLSCKIISRKTGRSVVAAAAYRAGDILVDEETGIVCDYSRKRGIIYSEICLPDHAPDEFIEREKLWNEVSKIENKSNSRMAREIEVALPKEFSHELQIQILKEYIKNNFVSIGMAADWSLHDKGDGNPHAHILLPTRGFKDNGEWDLKEKKAYKLDENGERIPIIDPLTGHQKIGARGRKMWERETIQANDWNRRENIETWREKWADICNEYLTPMDIDPITNLSFERLGLDQLPTRHEGCKAREMEARGIISERCQMNRDVIIYNRLQDDINDLAEDIVNDMNEKAVDMIEQCNENGFINSEVREGTVESCWDPIEAEKYHRRESTVEERFGIEKQGLVDYEWDDIGINEGERRFEAADYWLEREQPEFTKEDGKNGIENEFDPIGI